MSPKPLDPGAEADLTFDQGEATGPMRRCVASGLSKPTAELIRFVVGPDTALVPDLDSKLPGRGLWLSADRSSVETAIKKRAFSRAARGPVEVAPDLANRLEHLLALKAIRVLGLARRAGAVTAGYEKVHAALKAGTYGKGALLLAACDGASGGRDKIRVLAADVPERAVLSASEMGQALGRDHLVHAVLKPSGLTTTLIEVLDRLAGFRDTDQDDVMVKSTDG